jgi:hypothetical protein
MLYAEKRKLGTFNASLKPKIASWIKQTMSREYKLHLRVQLEDAAVSTCPTEPTGTKFIPPYTLRLARQTLPPDTSLCWVATLDSWCISFVNEFKYFNCTLIDITEITYRKVTSVKIESYPY